MPKYSVKWDFDGGGEVSYPLGMIERVARAIAGHVGPSFDDLPKDHAEYMKSRYTTSDETQESMLETAVAVIEAMRDPTEEMQRAGFSSEDEDGNWGGPSECWDNMIETALNE